MASLYKRGPVYWVKYYRPGRAKPIRASLETTDEKKALKNLKILEGQLAQGHAPDLRLNRLRFDNLLDAVVTDYTNNGLRSLSDLEIRIDKHISPVLGERRAVTITSADIADYVSRRKTEKAANATVNRELAVIKRAFSLAWRAYRLPGPYIQMLREDNVRTGFFDRAQLETLCRHLPAFLVPVARFAFLTAWRIGEIRQLEWRHIDFEGGEIRLDPGMTKNGKGRVFPLTQELRELLEPLKPKDRIATYVFTYTRGKKKKTILPLGQHKKEWRKACIAAGVPGRRFHDLRRSGVRQFVRDRIPETIGMKLSGHLTASTYRRYDIVSESDLEIARNLTEQGTKPGTSGKRDAGK